MDMHLHNDESRYSEFLSQELALLSEYLADEAIPSGLKRKVQFIYDNLYFELLRITDPILDSLFTEINGNLYA